MNITSPKYTNNPQKNISFKGYDARPLKYLIMRDSHMVNTTPIAKVIERIGDKHGFKMLFEGYDILTKIPSDKFNTRMIAPWIQDYIHVLKDKLITVGGFNRPDKIEKFFNRPIENISCENFVKGGNMFFVKKGDKDIIIVGNDDCVKAMKTLKKHDIVQIPQADYHIDLFLRPLRDGQIVVADDKLMLEILKNARKNLAKEYDLSTDEQLLKLDYLIKSMKNAIDHSHYKSTEKVISKLEKEGFSVIRVPGRIIKNYNVPEIKNILNFTNAIVHEDPNGELVYITNHSDLVKSLGIDKKLANKIGLNLEKIFKESLNGYIKPQNIYFVKGGKDPESNLDFVLRSYDGGIHCLCCEVPADIV